MKRFTFADNFSPAFERRISSGGVWLLGLILRKVSEQPIEEFAKKALFEPLGIQDEVWGRFPNGDVGTSSGLRLRPRDLAKLGQLVLDGGVWHSRRIVAAGWIKQMIASQSPRGWWFGFVRSYGFLWWQGQSKIGDRGISGSARLAAAGSASKPRRRHDAQLIRIARSTWALRERNQTPPGAVH